MARPRSNRRRGLGPIALIGVAGSVVVIAAAATVGGLYATGILALRPHSHAPDHTGQIACPALARPVEAYAAIRRDDLINPQTRQLHVIWVDEKLDGIVIRDLSKILGRVAVQDLSPNMAVSEANFFPPGTRPGVAAGVPVGKRAMTIPTAGVAGLDNLRQGDVFDLYAALGQASTARPESQVEYAALLGGIKPPDAQAGMLSRQAGVRRLVAGGTMVALRQGKTQSTAGVNGLSVPPTGSRRTTNETIATLAVDPDEVTALAEAISLETTMFCVVRSGRPDANQEPEFSLKGLVAVPVAVRPIRAYQAVSQDDVADPVSGKANVYYFSPEKVDPAWLTDLSRLIGRVLRDDLEPGTPFSEDAFFPVGTRPGLSAAAPPGTVVVTVDRSRVQGLGDLGRGDKFTIYAALPTTLRPTFPTVEWATLRGGIREPEDANLDRQLRSGVREALTEATLIDMDPTRSEVAVAASTNDVETLTRLMATDANLFAVAHGEGSPHGRVPPIGPPTRPGASPVAIAPDGLVPGDATPEGTLPSPHAVPAEGVVQPRPRLQPESTAPTGHEEVEVHRDQHAPLIPSVTAAPEEVPRAESPHHVRRPALDVMSDDRWSDMVVHQPSPLNPSTRPVDPVLERRSREESAPASDESAATDRGRGFPVLARAVPPYRQLTLDDFVDPATGKVRMFYFPVEQVADDWIFDLESLLDRVTGRAIRPGYVVREADLLPVGSGANFVGAIPEGWTSFATDTRQVSGLDGLTRGDRVTLVSVSSIDWTNSVDAIRWTVRGEAGTDLSSLPDAVKPTDFRVLAQEAVVLDISDVETREFRDVRSRVEQIQQDVLTPLGPSRTTTRTDEPTTTTYSAAVRDVVLAMPPDTVRPLAQARATGETVIAVAWRPGAGASANRGPATAEPAMPGASPMRNVETTSPVAVHVIEHLRNGQSRREAWIRPQDSSDRERNHP